MKLLATMTIWLVAALLAGLLILRLVRGRPTLVRSAVGRRALRVAAMVLVFTGTSGLVAGKAAGQDQPRARDAQPEAEDPVFEPMPAMLEHYLLRLPEVYASAQVGGSIGHTLGVGLALQDGEITFEQARFSANALLGLQTQAPNLDRIMREQLSVFGWEVDEIQQPDKPIDWDTVWAALEESRKPELLHPAVHSLIWRQVQGMTPPADDEQAAFKLTMIMDELETQARVYDTVVAALAQSRVAPMQFNQRAWMSKAGPQPERYRQRVLHSIPAIRQAARSLYPQTDAGSWRSEGLLALRTDDQGDGITLIRRGERLPIGPAQPFRFGRLDLLQTGEQGAALYTEAYGKIDLPANITLRASDLPALLSDEAQEKIAKAVQAVLDRPDVPLDQEPATPEENAAQRATVELERHLPLAAPWIAQAIREHPEQPGSATLRTLLNQYQLHAGQVQAAPGRGRLGDGF